MEEYIKLLFTGDVCFKVQHEMDAALAKATLSGVKRFFDGADLRIMNLETPLADEGVGAPIEKSGPNIIGRPQNLAFLQEAGADCAILANNHTKDYGEEALFTTIRLLDANGIAHCGAGRNITEAYEAWRVEKGGIRFSIIGVCENEFGIADVELSGTAGFCWERLSAKIAEEKTVSDFVIVVFHGGCEHNPLPSPLARERYRMIVRLGADAVVGGHPHCIQGYEIIDGKPILYSTGNFLFKALKPAPADDPWHYGYMVELSASKESRNLLFRLIPYRFNPEATYIEPFEGKELEAMMKYIEKLSSMIPDDTVLNRYYRAWCTISGFSYIRGLVSSPEYFDPANSPSHIAPLKNLLSCEAHNELCRTTLNLAFFGGLEEAIADRPLIRDLQKMPV